MDDIKAKQQVVEKIKEASKILVTVSNSPSVDALSAALGLTLLFDKQKKYATAIFSGDVPPAINFLEPEKTFDNTTDSLRDFIIALDKEKADHLRYKVEGDSVKIFITPYKTNISQDDLEFSQGDYNVELVIALGVDSQDHLDEALENHGQILHDATVITVSAGDQTSNLGGIDWHDAGASSLSEMVAGLAEALKDDKKNSLVDASIATALLTGIVAETDRFSNQHTTSKAMTVAAQLMSAGADQQLIATELQTGVVPELEAPEEQPETPKEVSTESLVKKEELVISHEEQGGETLEELEERIHSKQEESADDGGVDVSHADDEPVSDELAPEPETLPAPESNDQVANGVANVYALDEDDGEPSLGGTLNATTEQAADDARREAMSDQNKTILSHAYLGNEIDETSSPLGASPIGFPGTPPVAPGSVGINEVEEDAGSAYALSEKEVNIMPPASPTDFGLPLPPPLPDFSQGPLAPPPTLPVFPGAPAPAIPVGGFNQPEILGDILTSEPSTASLTPELSGTPQPNTPYSFEEPAVPPASSDPGQFKIPDQP